MLLFPQGRRGQGGFDDPHQLQCGGDRRFLPRRENARRDTPGIALLPVIPKDAVETLFVPGIHDLVGRELCRAIHAHIERRVLHVRKAALRLVKLRGRYPQIEEHPVHAFDPEGIQDRRRVGKVAVHQLHLLPKGRKAFSRAFDGGFIPVDANKTARGQTGRDLKRVSAHPQRAVQVKPIRFYVQVVDAFLQQYGNMLRRVHQNSNSSMTAAMFSGVVSAAKTALQASLSQSSAWLLQPTTVTFLVKPA